VSGLVFGTLWVTTLIPAIAWSGPVVQPIPFNHRIHAERGLTCDTCHQYVFEKPFAGIPRVGFCMACHSSDITQNPAAQPSIETVRRHAAAGTEIPWQRLYTLPYHVYYSHRRHTAIGGLECPTCHGDIGESETPPVRPIAQTLDMDNCMDCHEQRGVENDCAWCHR
jgi:hypothetical protein